MDIGWVKIVSWHAIRATRSIEPRTLCGRIAAGDAPISAVLPAERSRENCLRIVARRADA